MECPKCQHENPARAAFCEECGSKLEQPCPNCQEPNSPTAKFCLACGHEFGSRDRMYRMLEELDFDQSELALESS